MNNIDSIRLYLNDMEKRLSGNDDWGRGFQYAIRSVRRYVGSMPKINKANDFDSALQYLLNLANVIRDNGEGIDEMITHIELIQKDREGDR